MTWKRWGKKLVLCIGRFAVRAFDQFPHTSLPYTVGWSSADWRHCRAEVTVAVFVLFCGALYWIVILTHCFVNVIECLPVWCGVLKHWQRNEVMTFSFCVGHEMPSPWKKKSCLPWFKSGKTLSCANPSMMPEKFSWKKVMIVYVHFLRGKDNERTFQLSVVQIFAS